MDLEALYKSRQVRNRKKRILHQIVLNKFITLIHDPLPSDTLLEFSHNPCKRPIYRSPDHLSKLWLPFFSIVCLSCRFCYLNCISCCVCCLYDSTGSILDSSPVF